MLILTDAHVTAETEGEFFSLLQQISQQEPLSETLLFLGDVFELWVALPNFEQPIHRRFIQWVRQEEARGRRIIFLQGNHEFILENSSELEFVHPDWQEGDFYAVHGEKIATCPLGATRIILFLAHTRIVRWVMRHLPWAPQLADFLRRHMKHRDDESYHPPFDKVERWALAEQQKRGVKNIYLGHFHREKVIPLPNGGVCKVFAPWCLSHKLERI